MTMAIRFARRCYGAVKDIGKAPVHVSVATGLSLLLASCSVVSSELADSVGLDGTPPQGLFYALPTALVDITLALNQEAAEFELKVGDPKFIPDRDHRYLLRYREMPNYHDKITVEVNPDTSFLKKVHSDTTDKTDEIIVEIAKAFTSIVGEFESVATTNGYVAVATVTVDPTDPVALDDAASLLGRRASQISKDIHATSCGKDADVVAAMLPVCDRYLDLSRSSGLVKLHATAPVVIEPATPADCSVGLCYRGQEPWVIVAAFDGRPSARILELPNKSVIVELDVTRAIFVQKIQNIDFADNGQIKSLYIKKESELEAMAALPTNVISAVAETVPIRFTIRERQIDAAQKELALVKARRKLLAKREGGQPVPPAE